MYRHWNAICTPLQRCFNGILTAFYHCVQGSGASLWEAQAAMMEALDSERDMTSAMGGGGVAPPPGLPAPPPLGSSPDDKMATRYVPPTGPREWGAPSPQASPHASPAGGLGGIQPSVGKAYSGRQRHSSRKESSNAPTKPCFRGCSGAQPTTFSLRNSGSASLCLMTMSWRAVKAS